jgi:hypothetical protein
VRLGFIAPPTSGMAQLPLETVTVAIHDANGAIVRTATRKVTLALASNPGGVQLLGSVTATPVSGTYPAESIRATVYPGPLTRCTWSAHTYV